MTAAGEKLIAAARQAVQWSTLDARSCYVREATIDERPGWILIGSDGEIELFTENRSDVFFHAAERGMIVVRPN